MNASMSVRTVVFAAGRFHICHQFLCLLIMERLLWKICRQLNHRLCFFTFCPHDTGIVTDLSHCPCIYLQAQQILTATGQQILYRKHCLDSPLLLIPGIQLCVFHQPLQIQTANLITDSHHILASTRYLNRKPAFFRQNSQTFSGNGIPHILTITIHRIHLSTKHLNINDWQLSFSKHRILYLSLRPPPLAPDQINNQYGSKNRC